MSASQQTPSASDITRDLNYLVDRLSASGFTGTAQAMKDSIVPIMECELAQMLDAEKKKAEGKS